MREADDGKTYETPHLHTKLHSVKFNQTQMFGAQKKLHTYFYHRTRQKKSKKKKKKTSDVDVWKESLAL